MRTSLHCTLITAGAALLLGSLAEPARADILYVSDYSQTITRLNSSGVGSIFPVFGTSRFTGLAFGATGDLYAADTAVPNIVKITPGGVGSPFSGSPISPMGMAFDSAGYLFVAGSSGSILKIDPTGSGISTFADTDDGLAVPRALAFDSAGNLYASDFNSGNGGLIWKFTPDGVGSVFASTGSKLPEGLAFDSAGNLYVANNDPTLDPFIQKFTPDGVGSLFATTTSLCEGLAFDSAGNLYAAVFGNSTIEKFTPDGAGSVFADAADFLRIPQFLAFTDDNGVPLPLANQVPEPGASVLLGLGLPALLGFRRCRPTVRH